MPARQARKDGPRLSIGALSRETGVPIETLRTWESRYGFPKPERRPSGHRVYPLESIARLKRIAQALARGHRAGQIVTASDADLDALLGATVSEPLPTAMIGLADATPLEEILTLVEAFDADRLTRVLLADWARLGPMVFLETRIAPLIHLVGESWRTGRLEVRHEHFLSERVGDLLRSLRLPLDERARGDVVVLGSLPGETHSLGLQMAALVLALAGCRVLYLGTEVPVAEVATLAKDLGAGAVALSASSATRGARTNGHIGRLRKMLPKRVRLVVGGDGAPKAAPGVEAIQNLSALEAWARHLSSDARPAR
jgi:methanogenic corrinoid protein MtbC1